MEEGEEDWIEKDQQDEEWLNELIYKKRIMERPMDFYPTSIVYSNKDTHSDVMAIHLSFEVPEELESEEAKLMSEIANQGKKAKIANAKAAKSMKFRKPHDQMHRMLTMERDAYFFNVQKERKTRYSVENWAAGMVQKAYRRYSVKSKKNNTQQNPDSPACSEPKSSQIDHAEIRHNLNHIFKATDKVLGNMLPKKHRTIVENKKVSREKYLVSVIKIQSIIRRFLSIRCVKFMRIYNKIAEEKQAAVILQSRFRGHQYRKKEDERQANKRNEAAIRMQGQFRSKKARRRAAEKRQQKLEEEELQKSATKIQTMRRAQLARRETLERQQSQAAVKLQSIIRGRKDRERVAVLAEERKRASTLIQAQFRRKKQQEAYKLAREAQQLQSYLEQKEKDAHVTAVENHSATKLQAVYRGRQQRKTYNRLVSERAAVNIQKRMRSHIAKKQVHQMRRDNTEKEAATALQTATRGLLARKEFARRKEEKAHREDNAATSIQRSHRTKRARETTHNLRLLAFERSVESFDASMANAVVRTIMQQRAT